MTHEEFLELRKLGKIRAGVDDSAAMRLVDYLPKRYQYAHHFWSWIWFLSIPGFICVAIFYKWWAGLLLLFIVTPIMHVSIKKAASSFVLEYVEKNKRFYDELVKNDLIHFKQ